MVGMCDHKPEERLWHGASIHHFSGKNPNRSTNKPGKISTTLLFDSISALLACVRGCFILYILDWDKLQGGTEVKALIPKKCRDLTALPVSGRGETNTRIPHSFHDFLALGSVLISQLIA